MAPEATQSSFEYLVSMAFGSDELTPYTAQYSWNSNQMAHAMMGFFLAIFWLFFVISHRPGTDGGAQAPAGWRARLLGWFQRRPMWLYVVALFGTIPLKEVADILLDASNYSGSPVQANMPRLLFDSVTDTSFWWTGMFLAALMIGWFQKKERALRGGVPTVGLILCVLFWWKFAGPIWQNQKQTFDNSGMPFNYVRLAVQSGRDMIPFAGDKAAEWKRIEEFRTGIVNAEGGKPPQKHFVIFGGTPEDRSRLAVGMGCEYAFKLRGSTKYANETESIRALYVSAAALLERPQTLKKAELKLLECVVIDDLDVTAQRPLPDTRERFLEGIQYQAKAAEKIAAKPGEKKGVLVSDKVLTRFGIANPKTPAEAGSGATVLTAEKIENLKANKNGGRADPTKEEIQDQHLAAITALGGEAREGTVSTIWVFSGYSGLPGSPQRRKWDDAKKFWIEDIKTVLGIEEDDPNFIQINLAEPPAQPPGAKP